MTMRHTLCYIVAPCVVVLIFIVLYCYRLAELVHQSHRISQQKPIYLVCVPSGEAGCRGGSPDGVRDVPALFSLNATAKNREYLFGYQEKWEY